MRIHLSYIISPVPNPALLRQIFSGTFSHAYVVSFTIFSLIYFPSGPPEDHN